MRWAVAFLMATSIPLMLLSGVGALASAIWLVVLGDWRIVLYAVFITAFGHMLFRLALIPVGKFALIVVATSERNWKTASTALVLLANSYVVAIEVLWGTSIFLWFGQRWHDGNAIPLWILTFAVATGITAALSREEYKLDPNTTALVNSIVNQISFVTFSATIIYLSWPLTYSIILVIVIKLLGLGMSLKLRSDTLKQEAWDRIGQY